MTGGDDPTPYTLKAHRGSGRAPAFDWEDRQDFEPVRYGLIHRPDDPAIREHLGCGVERAE